MYPLSRDIKYRTVVYLIYNRYSESGTYAIFLRTVISVYFHIRRGIRSTYSVFHTFEEVSAVLIRANLAADCELMSVAKHIVRQYILRSIVDNRINRIFTLRPFLECIVNSDLNLTVMIPHQSGSVHRRNLQSVLYGIVCCVSHISLRVCR